LTRPRAIVLSHGTEFAERPTVMTISALDPKAALVVIDLQKGIVGLPCVTPATEIVSRARRLIDAFRAKGLPVALVNVGGLPPGRTEQAMNHPPASDWTELVPELNVQPEDIRVTKRSWGAFATTDLDAQLKARGVTQIVLCGVATSIGVEATARQAWDLGYNVALAADAATDLVAENQAHSLAKVFPRIAETGTVEDVLALLAKN